MLKIKALNESSSSSEDEDEDNPKLSMEAQEAQAKLLYEKAQRLTIDQEFDQAVETFAEILQLPYLVVSVDKKTLSPVQLQLRLGCLKCLSTLYTRGSTKNLEDAAAVLQLITEMEPKNVNFWYRLGKVALEMKDLELAFDAFKHALDCSPGHWGSIEHLVTISFALHDLLGCLRFCAIGLKKDSGFLKGHVFKNQVFKYHSWTQDVVKESKNEYESLFLEKIPTNNLDPNTGQKYLTEARELIIEISQKKIAQRKQEHDEANKPFKCPFLLKAITLFELGKVVLEVYHHLRDAGTLLKPVDMLSSQEEVLASSDEIITPEVQHHHNQINGDIGEEQVDCASVTLRSRSTSDDKDPVRDSGNDSSRPPNESLQVSETDEKMTEEDSQSVQQAQQGSVDDESAQRKKNKKDVKWWQIEGQRRSQRVRGNLVAAPIKPKPESTFAEMIRNIIPEALLDEESSSSSNKKDENHHNHNRGKLTRASHSNTNFHHHHVPYFGTNEERKDVKILLSQWKCINILKIISQLVRWLSNECCKAQWPSDLRKMFMKLYPLYRNSVPITFTIDFFEIENKIIPDNLDMEEDVFTILAQVELSLDSFSINNNVSNSPNIFLLDNALKVVTTKTEEFLLRLEWLKLKSHLQECKNDLIDHTYIKLHLQLILNLLKTKPDSYECILPTEHDSVISSAVVQDKLQYVQKIENVNKIEELYQANRFEDLIEILHFSLSSSPSSSSTSHSRRDEVQNRIYLTESYYKLGKIECIEQCEMLLHSIVTTKAGLEDKKLVTALKLLHNIWDEMKTKMSTAEFKMIINMLLKTLIQVEKQQELQQFSSNSSNFIMVEPWCLLHAVLYHLEQMESAFLIDDEESAPASILILQLGHEILSKIGKCSINDGQLLTYTINSLIGLESSDTYWSFEETKNCLDQAILCLYAHPSSKKFKLRNLKDHGTAGVSVLNWTACCQLYHYYKLEELPEFDSKPSKSINAEVENIFQRIISDIPADLKPTERYQQVKEYVKGCIEIADPRTMFEDGDERLELFDIYYLLADFYFKNQDLAKAVEFYIWDLAVYPLRFDSWTSIALTTAEDVVAKINACDAYKIEEVMKESEAVVRCFQQSLNLDLANIKVRIEFGSFLYSLHSVFSRELKFHGVKVNPEIVAEVEWRQKAYLVQSQSLFEPYKLSGHTSPIDVTEDLTADEDDAWINHYMLGKVAEKTHPNDPEKFLSQYILASQLLHKKCSTYPSKINYYNPPDNALEALEVYFRIHASTLSYIEKIKDYDKEIETMLLKYLKTAEESPFIKSKQGRPADGESKRKKAAGEDVSKKEMAIINSVVKQMLEKVEKMMECPADVVTTASGSSSNNSSTEANSSSDEDSKEANTNPSLPSTITTMKDLSLSAFRDRIREEDASKIKVDNTNLNGKDPSTLKSAVLAATPITDAVNQSQEASQKLVLNGAQVTERNHPYFSEFGSLPYGLVISMCLKAMKECVSRYPQYFKAFYRLAHAFITFKKDFKKAREYLLGNNTSGQHKITGLYGDRKPSNLFNGIWRHPIEDVDRPGSFAFYMSKSMQLLLTVLYELNDHQMLADVGIQLAKVPDSKNTYLYTEDREQYSMEAFRLCEVAARNSIPKKTNLLLDCGLSIYDTYIKFQKFNPKENRVSSVLLEVYKQHVTAAKLVQQTSSDSFDPTLRDAVSFFQQVVWSKTTSASLRPFCGYARPSNTDLLGKMNNTTIGNNTMLNKLPALNSLNNSIERPRKLNVKRRLSDQTNREDSNNPKVGPSLPQYTPSSIPSLMSASDYMNNFNSSVLAAQLASYNSVLQQQFSNYLNQQQPPTVVDSTTSNSQSHHHRSSMSGSEESVLNNNKKFQRPSSNIFRYPAPSDHDRLITNLANAMNNQANNIQSKKLKSIPNPLTRRMNVPSVSSNYQSFQNSSTITTTSVQQNKTSLTTSDKYRTESTQMQHEFSNLNSIESALKDFPNISCTKLSPTLPKLLPKPVKSFKFRHPNNNINNNSNNNSNNNNATTPPQTPKFNKSILPPNLASPSFVSCSPFQAQATAMTNPAIPGRYPTLPKNSSQQNAHQNSDSMLSLPQPAHSQAVNTQPRYGVNNNNNNSTLPAHSQQNRMIYPRLVTSTTTEPEVVDLTTKSPEKNTNTSPSQGIFTKQGLNITRTFENPTPNNFIDTPSSSVTMTKVTTTTTNKSRPKLHWTKALGSWDALLSKTQQPAKSTITTPRAKFMQINKSTTATTNNTHNNSNNTNNTYKSPTSYMFPTPVSINKLTKPQDVSSSSNKNTVPKSRPSYDATQQSIAPRPLKRQMTDQQYPLPPKKKHHIIIPTSPNNVEHHNHNDPDVEVITLE